MLSKSITGATNPNNSACGLQQPFVSCKSTLSTNLKLIWHSVSSVCKELNAILNTIRTAPRAILQRCRVVRIFLLNGASITIAFLYYNLLLLRLPDFPCMTQPLEDFLNNINHQSPGSQHSTHDAWHEFAQSYLNSWKLTIRDCVYILTWVLLHRCWIITNHFWSLGPPWRWSHSRYYLVSIQTASYGHLWSSRASVLLCVLL